MKSQAFTGNYQEANVEALAVAVFKDEKANTGFIKDLDKMTGGLVASVIKTEEFKGRDRRNCLPVDRAEGKSESHPDFVGRSWR